MCWNRTDQKRKPIYFSFARVWCFRDECEGTAYPIDRARLSHFLSDVSSEVGRSRVSHLRLYL